MATATFDSDSLRFCVTTHATCASNRIGIDPQFEVWFDRIILLLIALNSIGSGPGATGPSDFCVFFESVCVECGSFTEYGAV